MDCCCCCICEFANILSDIGENDNARLPLPSLEESDGVDSRESAYKYSVLLSQIHSTRWS